MAPTDMDTPSNPQSLRNIEDLLRHEAWLRPLVLELVGQAHVDDVLQQTWITALDHSPRQPSAIRSWLSKVARNLALSHRRGEARRRKHETAASTDLPVALPSTEETVQRLAAQQAVTEAVSDLAEPYRTVVLLRYYHELSVREIAERTGTSEANVRQRLKRGLEMLRQRMAERQGPDWASSSAMLALLEVRPSLPVSVGLPALTIGAILMSKKAVLISAAVVLGAVAVGWNLYEGEGLSSFSSAVAKESDRLTAGREIPLQAVGPAERQELAPPTKTGAGSKADAPKSYHYSGRVLDCKGRPVVAVTVGTTSLVSPWAFLLRKKGEDKPSLKVLAKTDGDGRFVFLGSPGSPDIDVEKSLAVVRRTPLELEQRGQKNLLLVVAPAVEFSGRVLDEKGRELEGVQVGVAVKGLTDFPEPLDQSEEFQWKGKCKLEAGRFLLTRLPGGVAKVTFEKKGLQSVCVQVPEQGAHGIEVVLRKNSIDKQRVLTGQVTDHRGQLVAGAVVSLDSQTTKTDSLGAYKLTFAAGTEIEPEARLYAAKVGLQTKVVEGMGAKLMAAMKPMQANLQFEGETLEISGRVLQPNGLPKSGILVTIWGEKPLVGLTRAEDLAADEKATSVRFGVSKPPVSATTGWLGGFKLIGLSNRKYELRIFDQSSLFAMVTEPVQAGSKDLEFRLPKEIYRKPVSGRVVTRDGLPVAAAEISVSVCQYEIGGSSSNLSHGGGKVDAEGHFVLERVPHGEKVSLCVYGEKIVAKLHVLGAEDPPGPLEIVVDRLCHFRIDVSAMEPLPEQFEILDDAGRMLHIKEARLNMTMTDQSRKLEQGKSPVLSTSEKALTLRLRVGSEVVACIPVRLVPGEVTVLRK